MTDTWINVEDRLPDIPLGEMHRYKCKVKVGSMTTHIEEIVLLGRHYHTGFRFIVGDWHMVTHWLETK